MPRPYSLRRRQAATDETRARIIAAARELLVSPDGVASFTVDAVARRADVARMTVYYQFESKRGLLEALFDDLAARGGMEQMPAVFAQADPLASLLELVALFGRFWASDRLLLRRVRALAALDPELERAVHTRDEWRHNACRAVLARLAERYGRPAATELADAADLLATITSFETFDALAGATRGPESMIATVQRLARAAFGFAGE